MNEIICEAIAARKLLQFRYKGAERVVEPHLLAANQANHLALSAWFVRGYSESGVDGENRWREYLLSEISDLVLLDETFTETRTGYDPTGGAVFHDIICAVEILQ